MTIGTGSWLLPATNQAGGCALRGKAFCRLTSSGSRPLDSAAFKSGGHSLSMPSRSLAIRSKIDMLRRVIQRSDSVRRGMCWIRPAPSLLWMVTKTLILPERDNARERARERAQDMAIVRAHTATADTAHPPLRLTLSARRRLALRSFPYASRA
jgi:hypothetical protein